MGFTSFAFILGCPVCLAAYYLCPKKAQNPLLLLACYLFYGWMLPAGLVYLLGATAVVYFGARMLEKQPGRKSIPLCISILMFGLLFVFKYMNYVCNSLLHSAGLLTSVELKLIAPIGISFFTFALMGYLYDVYAGRLRAEHNVLRFAVFAAYFPSILSGPINRGSTILPALETHRKWNTESVKHGLMRFVEGASKKLILANSLGSIVDTFYADIYQYSPVMWIFCAFCYSIEIYIDFTAYSDMAIGVSEMFGIRLLENFRAPYLSVTVKDFWKKWHISLTSWFRDYLYFPLGGNRAGKWRTQLNILIVFAVSGIWHGEGFTFLFWGLLNGLYQVLGNLTMPKRRKALQKLHIRESSAPVILFRGAVTFVLVSAAWVFFRSTSLSQALWILAHCLLVFRDGVYGFVLPVTGLKALVLAVGLVLCLAEDILINRNIRLDLQKTSFRFWIVTALLLSATLVFGQYGVGVDAREFIYFQF